MVIPYIITAITYQQRLVSDKRFLWEERIVEAVLSVKYLIRLKFHRTRIDISCPSTRNTNVNILVEKHTFRRTDVTEVHWTVPRLVPVYGSVATFTGNTIGTLYVNTPHRIGKVTLITYNRDDGNGIVVTCLDKTTSDRNTGQITIFEKTEYIISSPCNSKFPVRAFLTVSCRTTFFGCRWNTAVGRIHQRSTIGDINMKCERTINQLTTRAHHRSIKSIAGKDCCGICGTRCSIGSPVPPFFTISSTCPRSTTHCFGIFHAGDQLSVLVTQTDGTAIAVEFKGRLITLDFIRPHPHNQITLGRHSTYVVGHLPLGQIVCIIAEIHT